MFKTTLIAAIALAGAQAIKISSQATDFGMLDSVLTPDVGPSQTTTFTEAIWGTEDEQRLAQTGFDADGAEATAYGTVGDALA